MAPSENNDEPCPRIQTTSETPETPETPDTDFLSFSSSYFSSSSETESHQRSKSHSKKRKIALQPTESPSKSYLCPARDILHHIKHDPWLEEADFRVAYLDRHAGVVEMPVENWGSAKVEKEHQIVFFQRVSDGRIVWDRIRRRDEIFWTGFDAKKTEDRADNTGMATGEVDDCVEAANTSFAFPESQPSEDRMGWGYCLGSEEKEGRDLWEWLGCQGDGTQSQWWTEFVEENPREDGFW